MEQNKTSKYFKYAIGEIILVVIGILIALQVSNWNEIRKTQNKTEALLDKFVDELENTVRNANYDISNTVKGDSLMKSILFNNVTRKDYLDNESLRDLLIWRFTLNPGLDNLDKLVEKEEILDEKYKEILFAIDHFNFTREREVDAMNLLRVSAEQNADYINMNFPWARLSDSLSNERAYQYFLTDENYKNRLFAHWEKCMNYTIVITMYRVELLNLLSKLKMIREGYSSSELESYLKKQEQKPFEKLDLNQNIADLVSEDHTVKSSLIANFTKDTLDIISKNRKGDIFRSIKINPERIITSRPFLPDLYSDNLKIFEVHKNGKCIAKYKEVQYGYLILEK